MVTHKKLQLGDYELESNLLTSPLCGISNRPFRRLAKRFGSGLSYVEMTKARGLLERRPKVMQLMKYYADEKPLGAQLAGSEPEELSEACKILEDIGFDTIDLNCGCPSGRVGKGLCGARLMSRPQIARDCLRAMRKAVKIPITVKIRGGMNSSSLNYLEFGEIAESEGMAWITIHPRTRIQGYKGDADHSRSAELKAHVNIPVIASGDVKTAEDAIKLTEHYKLDGVMIGRGIFGRPWLYRQILEAQNARAQERSFESSEYAPAPREVIAVLRWHFEGLVEVFGPELACILQRRYSGWYIKGIPGAAHFRALFVTIQTPDEFYEHWSHLDQVFAELEQSGKIPKASEESLSWSFQTLKACSQAPLTHI